MCLEYFLYLPVVLQKTARYVQRDVGAVDDAVQKRQKFGNDFLDIVSNVNLIAIQLYLTAFKFDLALYLREIQNTFQAERILHIQMYPEKRIVVIVECFTVKLFIFLFRAIFRIFQIQRMRVVQRLVVPCP